MDFSLGHIDFDCTYANWMVSLSTALGVLVAALGPWLMLRPRNLAGRSIVFFVCGVIVTAVSEPGLMRAELALKGVHPEGIGCIGSPTIHPLFVVTAASVLSGIALGVRGLRQSAR